jgi:hypothetical protein
MSHLLVFQVIACIAHLWIDRTNLMFWLTFLYHMPTTLWTKMLFPWFVLNSDAILTCTNISMFF